MSGEFKVIPQEFTKNGWHYVLLERNQQFAIYNQGGGSAFELVRIRTRKEVVTPHCVYPAGEYLPGNEEWGRHGWTYPNLEKAKNAMREKMEEKA